MDNFNNPNFLYVNNDIINKLNDEEIDYLYIEEFDYNLSIGDYNKEMKDNIELYDINIIDNIEMISFKNKTINLYLYNVKLNTLKCKFKINKLIIKNCVINKIKLLNDNIINNIKNDEIKKIYKN